MICTTCRQLTTLSLARVRFNYQEQILEAQLPSIPRPEEIMLCHNCGKLCEVDANLNLIPLPTRRIREFSHLDPVVYRFMRLIQENILRKKNTNEN